MTLDDLPPAPDDGNLEWVTAFRELQRGGVQFQFFKRFKHPDKWDWIDKECSFTSARNRYRVSPDQPKEKT